MDINSDFNLIKSNRAGAKASITRVATWYDKNKDSVVDSVEVKSRLTHLKEVFERYNQAQDLISYIVENEIVPDATDSEVREEVENKYFSLCSSLEDLIKKLSPGPSAVKVQNIVQTNPVPAVTQTKVRLPEIEIKPFTGKIAEWQSFSQLFNALIANDCSLSDLQKFMYLKSYLRNEPLNLIEDLPIEEASFNIAKNVLEARYDSKLSVIMAYCKSLFEVKSVNKGSVFQLREFITNINKAWKTLKNLKYKDDQLLEIVIIYHLQHKLDYTLRHGFQTHVGVNTLPTFDQFYKFLNEKCTVSESLISEDSSSTVTGKKVIKSSLIANREINTHFNDNQICIFCNDKSHKIYNCNKFKGLPPNDRYNFVKTKGICFNCFSSRHYLHQCSSRTCKFCNQKHNTLIHDYFNRNLVSNNSTEPRSSQTSHVFSNKRFSDKSKPQHAKSNHNVERQTANVTDCVSNELSLPTGFSGQRAVVGSAAAIKFADNSHNSQVNQSSSTTALSTQDNQVLLGTLLAYVYDHQGDRVPVKVLLDTGSQSSFITSKLVKRLNLQVYDRSVTISGIGLSSSVATKMVSLTIHSSANLFNHLKVSLLVLSKITCKLPQVDIEFRSLQIPNDLPLADSQFFKSSEIDILLGADHYYDLITDGLIRLGRNLPILLNTHFGWVVAGSVPTNFLKSNASYSNSLFSTHNSVSMLAQTGSESDVDSSTQDMNAMLARFWEIEEVSYPKEIFLTPEGQQAENLFVSTTKILSNGRFQVNLPLKSPEAHSKLGDSFYSAQKRFFSLERKFGRDPLYFEQYRDFISEYIELKHAKVVPLSQVTNDQKLRYFFPHHAVVREDKSTTKLRVVFDGSARTTSGLSLNDIMWKGYQVQPNLFDILCRFRTFRYVFTADIEKMFRQIIINPQQTFLLNILWRDSPSQPLQSIELSTVTYGTNCAPFLATRVLREIGEINKSSFPLASQALLEQTYIDDTLVGSETLNDLYELHSELVSLLSSHGFSLHKFCSNSAEFLRLISGKSLVALDLSFDNASTKVLGLKWSPSLDHLRVSIPENSFQGPVTKRKILSFLAQCFDPLGLLAPVIVIGKLLMQKLWLLKVDWDSEISDRFILNAWNEFVPNLHVLSNLQIPRYLFLPLSVVNNDIHGFCDASQQAYAACIYVRTEYSDGSISCNLITSKSRVSPLKVVSLPRLELCAMLLLAKLLNQILDIFKDKIKFTSRNLWSDSSIALHWINSHPSKWSVFVANRVAQIQNLTSKCSWRHIRSALNPADLPSRGLQPNALLNSELWWHGPHFLLDSNLDLHVYDFSAYIPEVPEEKRVPVLTSSSETPLFVTFWEQLFSRFSNFSRLHHCIAFCFRFVRNARLRSCPNSKEFGPLTVVELENSLNFILQTLQQLCFSEELAELKAKRLVNNKAIISLNPFFDEQTSLIRVGGRLKNADVSFSQRHPILLPSRSTIVDLLLKQEHERLGHAGAQTVLSNFRLRYWPLNGLRRIKKLIRQCMVCFRFRAQPLEQIMATLPKDRVNVSRPFQKVGVDYGGPFLIKTSRLRKAPITKAYIAIFVCMATKATHIEVVSGLSTESFLMTLKRFIARRGNVSVVYSDNATNFLGARNQLLELRNFFRKQGTSDAIKDFLSKNEIDFRFIPPRSPHWGGLWESAIKSAKFHIARVVGNATLTFEEFSTVMAQIEAVLNSRPISPLSSDPNDFGCLTPGHFLIGCPITAYPEKDVANIPENRLSLFQRISQMQQRFWNRWSVDYLNLLQNRPKWLRQQPNVKTDDLVLLKEDNVPPLKWSLARVAEAIPGRDGKVRVVKLKTSLGEFTRPITKVCPLPQFE